VYAHSDHRFDSLSTRGCIRVLGLSILRGPHERSLSPGTSNCSWTSCREGCTKELYDCTQIRVNYKLPENASEGADEEGGAVGGVEDDEGSKRMPRYERSLAEYVDNLDENLILDDETGLPKPFPTGTRDLRFVPDVLCPYIRSRRRSFESAQRTTLASLPMKFSRILIGSNRLQASRIDSRAKDC